MHLFSGINASVAMVVSESDVVRPADKMQNLIVIVGLIMAFIAIIVGILIGNGIARSDSSVNINSKYD